MSCKENKNAQVKSGYNLSAAPNTSVFPLQHPIYRIITKGLKPYFRMSTCLLG